MFVLSDADLGLRILSCADGPASFNAESTRRGTAVVSMDPLYRLDTTVANYASVLSRFSRAGANSYITGIRFDSDPYFEESQ
jgi:hypothetical protein